MIRRTEEFLTLLPLAHRSTAGGFRGIPFPGQLLQQLPVLGFRENGGKNQVVKPTPRVKNYADHDKEEDSDKALRRMEVIKQDRETGRKKREEREDREPREPHRVERPAPERHADHRGNRRRERVFASE